MRVRRKIDPEGFEIIEPRKSGRPPSQPLVYVGWAIRSGKTWCTDVRIGAEVAKKMGWSSETRLQAGYKPEANQLRLAPAPGTGKGAWRLHKNRHHGLICRIPLPHMRDHHERHMAAPALYTIDRERGWLVIHMPAWAQPESFKRAARAADEAMRRVVA